MAVTFFPFNSIVVDGVPDRPANAENLAAYLAGFFSNGVLMQTDTALKVEASEDMLVQIHAGMGVINGKSIRNDAAHIIALENASASLDRIDRIIIRLDETARYMMFDVLKGTPASNPVPPALTQAADIYELCLAEIRVPAGASKILASHITDTRADTDLCGLANIPAHMQDLEHGGTGISAETKEALLLALGGISKKLIWQNASPTSTFPPQTLDDEDLDVDVDLEAPLAEYDAFEVVCMHSTSSQNAIKTSVEKGIKNFMQITSWQNYAGYRSVTITDKVISFEKCVYSNTDNQNTFNIPYRVYGIKGVQ